MGTLRFGEDCRLVERSDRKRDSVSKAVRAAVKAIDVEVAELEQAIKEKERWASRTTAKTITVSAMDTGGTTLNEDEETELGGKGAVEFGQDDGNSTKLTVSMMRPHARTNVGMHIPNNGL